ncbi:MAG: choice-of-anchor D domain-containing protein [Myxococcota bacterium]|nr:choice-of-anchor D domain-containing protein [Myxococcota bacterium]
MLRVGPILLSLAACSPETEINALTPDIAVAPEALEFGEVIAETDDTQTIQVVNAGLAPLVISDVTLSDHEDVFTLDWTEAEIARDDSLPLSITFAPDTYAEYELSLVFTSNDTEKPALEVPVTAEGVKGPIPDIHLDTQSLDFDVVATGDTQVMWFTISNVGDGDLEISSTDQTGSGSFEIQSDPDATTIAASGESTVVVTYEPSAEEGDSGTFVINSNDPDEPETIVTFLGNGGGDYEYPEAVIDCPEDAAPLDTLYVDGTGSYDPNGYEPLNYEWTLSSQPTGSTTEVEEELTDTAILFLDLAGTYVLSLSVENSLGIKSAPEKCTLEAIPEDDVHIELVWSTDESDLDLHLIEEDGAFFDKPSDCCFCNPSPDWGTSGDEDDPSLDLDDMTGYGPENINITAPADGNYYVRVHYFEDNGGGTSVATVRFYVLGALEAEFSETLERNETWDVGYVRWPEALVAEEGADPYDAEERSCY